MLSNVSIQEYPARLAGFGPVAFFKESRTGRLTDYYFVDARVSAFCHGHHLGVTWDHLLNCRKARLLRLQLLLGKSCVVVLDYLSKLMCSV